MDPRQSGLPTPNFEQLISQQQQFQPDFDKVKFLLVTLLVCALAGIPFAFFAGGVRGEGTLRLEMDQEITALRIDQTNALAALREEIGMLHQRQDQIAVSLKTDMKNAGIETAEVAPPKEADILPEPETVVAMITDGQIEQLENGIDYARTVGIVGRDGVLTMEMKDAQSTTRVYEWTWVNADGVDKKISLRYVSGVLDSRSVE